MAAHDRIRLTACYGKSPVDPGLFLWPLGPEGIGGGLGFPRAEWTSSPRRTGGDGIRERSADRIRPELQDLRVGDRVPDSPDWSVFFTVAALEPERALVLHSTRHLLKPMRSLPSSVVGDVLNASAMLRGIRRRCEGAQRAPREDRRGRATR